jgi:Mg/Co/Ni transporter MgtE
MHDFAQFVPKSCTLNEASYSPVRENRKLMSELGVVLEQLRKKRNSLVVELRQVDQAIKALSKLGVRTQRRVAERSSKRRLSAEAREKIAAAQRARWAKIRSRKSKAG